MGGGAGGGGVKVLSGRGGEETKLESEYEG